MCEGLCDKLHKPRLHFYTYLYNNKMNFIISVQVNQEIPGFYNVHDWFPELNNTLCFPKAMSIYLLPIRSQSSRIPILSTGASILFQYSATALFAYRSPKSSMFVLLCLVLWKYPKHPLTFKRFFRLWNFWQIFYIQRSWIFGQFQ